MKITIKPSDLITRFVWDKYQYFCMDGKNTAKINRIIKADQEFEISEEDAFVIGLTNVIYTTEVVYKFQQFCREVLDNKNFEQDAKQYINRQILLDCVAEFKNKIPRDWTSESNAFNAQMAMLPGIYAAFEKAVNNLVTINVQEWPCVKYAQAKKIINKLNK